MNHYPRMRSFAVKNHYLMFMPLFLINAYAIHSISIQVIIVSFSFLSPSFLSPFFLSPFSPFSFLTNQLISFHFLTKQETRYKMSPPISVLSSITFAIDTFGFIFAAWLVLEKFAIMGGKPGFSGRAGPDLIDFPRILGSPIPARGNATSYKDPKSPHSIPSFPSANQDTSASTSASTSPSSARSKVD